MYKKKSLGQHFLTNPRIAQHMVDAANITEGDTVLEIGPGEGVLTRPLLASGAHITAIEADIRAVETLKKVFHEEIGVGALTVFHEDMRTFDLATLGFTDAAFAVVANIPYYITGLLFETVLSGAAKPHTVVFLVQKEVAERIARSKKESLLSLSVKAYGTPHLISTVARGNFSPPPQVDSAILKITDISRDTFARISEASLFRVIKTGFKARRKQLLGNLTTLAERQDLLKVFSTLNIPPDARGEDIPIEIWEKLTYALIPHMK